MMIPVVIAGTNGQDSQRPRQALRFNLLPSEDLCAQTNPLPGPRWTKKLTVPTGGCFLSIGSASRLSIMFLLSRLLIDQRASHAQ